MSVKEAACWLNDDTHDWHIMRSMSICIPIMEAVLAWVDKYDITHLEVCIETPFMSRNPATVLVQMSLFTMMQTYIYDYLTPIVPELYLTVVHNATSKSKLAHNGKATKNDMITSSPWSAYKAMGITHNQAHTLADSYAHSLSAYKEEWALHNMPQYAVSPNYEESADE